MTVTPTGHGRCFACYAANAPGRMLGLIVFLCVDCYSDDAVRDAHDPAAGEYPIDAYAARLAWLLGSSRHEFTVDDWRAGPLVLADVGPYRFAYGGDAAEEGAVGVSIQDHENEPVHLPGLSNEEGWIGDDLPPGCPWDGVRDRVRTIVTLTTR